MLPYNKTVHDLKNVLNGMKFFADLTYGKYDFSTEIGSKAKEEFHRDIAKIARAIYGESDFSNPFSICEPLMIKKLFDEVKIFVELAEGGKLLDADLKTFKERCTEMQKSVHFDRQSAKSLSDFKKGD